MPPDRSAVFGSQSGFCLPFLFLAAAFGCTILENVPAFDQLAQVPFFRPDGWLIDKTFHAGYKYSLYTGPKVLIGIVGGIFLLLFLISFLPRYKFRLQTWRKPLLLILASIILVPLAVAAIKAFSGVYSPVDLLPYGGKHPHIGLLDRLWTYGVVSGGRSFPAGHASGGFALMALYYLPLRDVWKRILFCFGLVGGWGMGLYQMARGEHFLSHTLTSMFLALAIITMLSRFILKEDNRL